MPVRKKQSKPGGKQSSNGIKTIACPTCGSSFVKALKLVFGGYCCSTCQSKGVK